MLPSTATVTHFHFTSKSSVDLLPSSWKFLLSTSIPNRNFQLFFTYSHPLPFCFHTRLASKPSILLCVSKKLASEYVESPDHSHIQARLVPNCTCFPHSSISLPMASYSFFYLFILRSTSISMETSTYAHRRFDPLPLFSIPST